MTQQRPATLRLICKMWLGVFFLCICGGCGGDGKSVEHESSGIQSRWSTLGTRSTEAKPNIPVSPGRITGWSDYNPPAVYSRRMSTEHHIVMPDGAKLAATVVTPVDDSGKPVSMPLPTIVSMTAYNKLVGSFVPALGGANAYLVSHGYVHVIVDVRGTGASDGRWDSFGEPEQADYLPILQWIADQPFCDGNIGLYGISYVGITALLATTRGHPAVKAVFPIFPSADPYRDLVFAGGQVNLGFYPFWFIVVETLNLLNTNLLTDPLAWLTQLSDRLNSALGEFSIPVLLDSVLGGEDIALDSEFWRIRSPIEQAEKIRVPTFIVGGLQDIFQRGEPLLYEALKNQTTTKLLIGPWAHLDVLDVGPLTTKIPNGGVPPLDHIALQWFDRYLKGLNNGADQLPPVTQYVLGDGGFVSSADWPHPEAQAKRYYLRAQGALTEQAPVAEETDQQILQQPFSGLCSPSTDQSTGGVQGILPLPCYQYDNLATLLDARYETAPLDEGLYLNGPLQADIWISTSSKDTAISVRISDVSPTGQAAPVSDGLLMASLREVDERRSRTLNGVMIQPWHMFSPETKMPLAPGGEPVLLRVEIAPASAFIAAGHRLRVSIGSIDFWHGIPPLPDLIAVLGGLTTVHVSEKHVSGIVVPVVPGGIAPESRIPDL